jgi:hypothetical protein
LKRGFFLGGGTEESKLELMRLGGVLNLLPCQSGPQTKKFENRCILHVGIRCDINGIMRFKGNFSMLNDFTAVGVLSTFSDFVKSS